jgi:hypothetical protein
VQILNRILVILGLLAIMIVSAIFFIASGPFFQIIIASLQQTDAALTALAGPNLVLRWAGGFVITVVVWAICVALLWLEVRRPRARTIVVQQVSGGQAELTADSIISRLEYNLDQLPEVVRVKPRVVTARKGVRVDLAVETSPEVDVPSKSEEIQRVTRDIIENQMGLKLESMRVVMRHAPYPKSYFKGHKPETTGQPLPAARPQPMRQPVLPPVPALPATSRYFERPAVAPTPPARPVEAPIRPIESIELPRAAEPQPEPVPAAIDIEPALAETTDKAPWRPWSFLRSRSTADAAVDTVVAAVSEPPEDSPSPAPEPMGHELATYDTPDFDSTDQEAEDKSLPS